MNKLTVMKGESPFTFEVNQEDTLADVKKELMKNGVMESSQDFHTENGKKIYEHVKLGGLSPQKRIFIASSGN